MTSTTARSSPHLLPASATSSPNETPAEAVLRDAEEELFARVLADGPPAADAPAVFILGAPRTGSTVLYQAVARYLRLPYFSNLANEVAPARPAVVAPLQRDLFDPARVEFTSAYGKTRGAFQPSEASGVMRNWFGGGHPSQVTSTRVLAGKGFHMVRTFATLHRLYAAPVVTKNPWNCFRIASIAELLPRAVFVWIRRDISAAARSDLAARYVVQGDPGVWNSATPANYEELQRTRPYWGQVVENQYEFSAAIRIPLAALGPGRAVEIWYEDLLRDPTGCLAGLAARLGGPAPADVALGGGGPVEKPFRPGDEDRVREYVAAHADRLADLRYPGRAV